MPPCPEGAQPATSRDSISSMLANVEKCLSLLALGQHLCYLAGQAKDEVLVARRPARGKRNKLLVEVIRASVLSVRTLVRVLLLSVLVFQLGPACGFANASAMASMECCRTKCPSRSSRIPATCCRIFTRSDKATSSTTSAPQGVFGFQIGFLAPVVVEKISNLSFITYRSPAPPPHQMRLNLFCSRQV